MKIQKLLQNDRLYLRELELADVNENYQHWMNDEEVTRFLEIRGQSYSLDDLKKYVEKFKKDEDSFLYGIFLNHNQRHIGNVKLGPINWRHRFAEIGLVIGEKDCWRKGYATEVLKTIVNYGFTHFKLHKVIVGYYRSNIGALKICEKVGFVIEGICRKQYLYEGHYVDSVRLGLLNPQGLSCE